MMEKFYNSTQKYFNLTDWVDISSSMSLHSWVILPIALPMVCVAICGLFSLIKTDHVAPVYVINLLISDVLQICTKPIALSIPPSGVTYELVVFTYSSSLMACVGFMVCIAGERYVMIAHPLWYRCHRTITKSLLCSFTVWMTAFVIIGGITLASAAFVVDIHRVALCLCIINLLPYPFVMLFFVGTWRALSKSKSVSSREQRRIMGTLALVLFIYTALFLPYIVLMQMFQIFPELMKEGVFQRFAVMSSTLLSLNPMVDPILYVFMRKKDLLVLPCRRCRQHPQAQKEFFLTLPTGVGDRETIRNLTD